MHTILVINLILTICLCDNYSLHNSILYIINNIIYLKQMHLSATSKEIGKLVSLCHCLLVTFYLANHCTRRKHQRESIPRPHQFSIIHIFRVKIFDSSHGFSANQKHTKIQILTQATPTIENGFNLLSINIPEKSVSFNLNSLIHSVT